MYLSLCNVLTARRGRTTKSRSRNATAVNEKGEKKPYARSAHGTEKNGVTRVRKREILAAATEKRRPRSEYLILSRWSRRLRARTHKRTRARTHADADDRLRTTATCTRTRTRVRNHTHAANQKETGRCIGGGVRVSAARCYRSAAAAVVVRVTATVVARTSRAIIIRRTHVRTHARDFEKRPTDASPGPLLPGRWAPSPKARSDILLPRRRISGSGRFPSVIPVIKSTNTRRYKQLSMCIVCKVLLYFHNIYLWTFAPEL